MKIVTLEELGPTFPYLRTPFTTKPWRGKEEREVAKILGKPGTEQVNSKIVASVLSIILEDIQGTEWKQWDTDERRRHIFEKRYSGDAMYAFCYVRREAVGPVIPVKFMCPSCDTENIWKGDLNTLEIKVAEDESDVVSEYGLRDPIDYSGNKIAVLNVRASTLAAAASLVDSEEEVALHLIRNACTTKDGFPMTDAAIDLVSKRDIQGLIDRIMSVNFGPDFRSKVECSKCRIKITAAMDMRYEPFFDTSSPSSMKMLIED